MGQCISRPNVDVYTPPEYTQEDIKSAILGGNNEYFTKLLGLLTEDDRFRSHKIVAIEMIPSICKALIDISYKKEKELTPIDILLFDCMIKITSVDDHVNYILSTVDTKSKLLKKLVENITYRRDVIQVSSCSIVANISMVSCAKLSETSLPNYLKTSMRRSSTSQSSQSAMIIMDNITKYEEGKQQLQSLEAPVAITGDKALQALPHLSVESLQNETTVPSIPTPSIKPIIVDTSTIIKTTSVSTKINNSFDHTEEDVVVIGHNISTDVVLNKMNEINQFNRIKQIELASRQSSMDNAYADETIPFTAESFRNEFSQRTRSLTDSIKAMGTLVMLPISTIKSSSAGDTQDDELDRTAEHFNRQSARLFSPLTTIKSAFKATKHDTPNKGKTLANDDSVTSYVDSAPTPYASPPHIYRSSTSMPEDSPGDPFSHGLLTEALNRISPKNSPTSSPISLLVSGVNENSPPNSKRAAPRHSIKRKSLGGLKMKPAKPNRQLRPTAAPPKPGRSALNTFPAPQQSLVATKSGYFLESSTKASSPDSGVRDMSKELPQSPADVPDTKELLSSILARRQSIRSEVKDEAQTDPKASLSAMLGKRLNNANPPRHPAPPLTPSPVVEEITYKNHPIYSKYFTMLAAHGKDVIAQELVRDGHDASIIDKDPDAVVPKKTTEERDLVMLKDHPIYEKYFKMIKIGQTKEIVAHRMVKEEQNPDVLDMNPTEKVSKHWVQQLKTAPKEVKTSTVKKKRLYWNTVEPGRVGAESFWNEAKDDVPENKIEDDEEFKILFVIDQTKASVASAVGSPPPTQEKSRRKLTLIDTKRDNGGNIALKQIKVPTTNIRKAVEELDLQLFTGDHLMILHEYLPTDEESTILAPHIDEISSMSLVERYMLSMASFPTASARLKCLIFKDLHKARLGDANETLRVIDNACDDVKLCIGLKKVLKTILRVGNQMNDAEKTGFTMDSLLKLKDTKAVDQKTSLLLYIISLIYKNDPPTLHFSQDLKHIAEAVRLPLEGILSECVAYQRDFKDASALFKKLSDADKLNELSPDHEINLENLISFFTKAAVDIEELAIYCRNVKEKYDGVLSYFGENPKLPSEEFFNTLNLFVCEFNVTKDSFLRQKNAEAKRLAKEAELGKRSSASTAVKSTVKVSSINTPGARFSARV